jgi:hypothetical protein
MGSAVRHMEIRAIQGAVSWRVAVLGGSNIINKQQSSSCLPTWRTSDDDRPTTSGKLHNPSCSSKDSLVCACYHYCYAVDSCFQLSAAIVLSLGQFPFTMGSRTPQTRCASAGFVQLIPSLASWGGYTSWPTKTMSHTDDRRILSLAACRDTFVVDYLDSTDLLPLFFLTLTAVITIPNNILTFVHILASAST